MKQADFEHLVERIRKETTDLLIAKGREYAGSADRLANFKRGAALTGVAPLTVLFIYMSKHYDALATYVRDSEAGTAPTLSEPITSRIADLINYCTLAWALIEEGHTVDEPKPVEVSAPQPAPEPAPQPAPRRVRVRAVTGQIARLEGDSADQFLLAVNRLPAGTDLVFEGARIDAWRYEDETSWRKC